MKKNSCKTSTSRKIFIYSLIFYCPLQNSSNEIQYTHATIYSSPPKTFKTQILVHRSDLLDFLKMKFLKCFPFIVFSHLWSVLFVYTYIHPVVFENV